MKRFLKAYKGMDLTQEEITAKGVNTFVTCESNFVDGKKTVFCYSVTAKRFESFRKAVNGYYFFDNFHSMTISFYGDYSNGFPIE